MYRVIDQLRDHINSTWDDFDDAMARAEELAEEQAGEDVPEISGYENGAGQWAAGA